MFKHKKELSSWMSPRTGLLSPDITSKDSQDFRVHHDREAGRSCCPHRRKLGRICICKTVKYLAPESKLESCDDPSGEQSHRNFQLPSLFPAGVFMSTLGVGVVMSKQKAAVLIKTTAVRIWVAKVPGTLGVKVLGEVTTAHIHERIIFQLLTES